MQKVSAEEAISKIESKHRLLLPPGCGHPTHLVEELGRQAGRFDRLTILAGLSLAPAPYFEERYANNFSFVSYHAGGPARAAIARGQGKYVPLRYFETIAAFSPGGPLAADIVIVQVAPPGKDGRHSLGTSVSYSLPVAKKAPLVIAQMNPQMPCTLGHAFLDEAEIDFLVEHEEPLVAYDAPVSGEVEQSIARHIAGLIPDGATVQVGIGAVPEALLAFLTDKKDLRLHSLLVDSALGLFEKGAARGGPEGSRICEIMGSKKLFGFAHDNPDVFMEDSSIVHDPVILSKTPKFVSVISALEVDLTGQVAAEAIGTKLVAGIGGQLDFAMGSAFGKDSLSIVALPSKGGRDGKNSRIVERLSPGAAVTTPRSLVRFVATEHGVTDLGGLDLDARAKALTKLAAPEFREDLERSWRERGKK